MKITSLVALVATFLLLSVDSGHSRMVRENGRGE